MSTEKAQAIVIRQADFSESSRVVTFFSREFGKVSALAKGAKRLKGPFDAALDLLSNCRIVFIRKNSGALNLLTQAKLVSRFTPIASSLNSVYGGYYVADLLCCLTEEDDPDPRLFDLAESTLLELSDDSADFPSTISYFEVHLLTLVGLFPNLSACCVCSEPVELDGKYAHWVSQGGLLCGSCRKEDYEGRSVSAGSVHAIRRIADTDSTLSNRVRISQEQAREVHRLSVSVITQALGRKPNTLRYLKF